MLLNSINQDDYRNFTGNIGKVGLGLVSILFDLLFIIQHYILYRHKDDPILETNQSNYGSSKKSKQIALCTNLKNSNDNSNNEGIGNPGYYDN